LPFIGLIRAFVDAPLTALGPLRGPAWAKTCAPAVTRRTIIGLHRLLLIIHEVNESNGGEVKKEHVVSSFSEAKANIDRYERELAKSTELQEIMSYARSWHGYLAPDGGWRGCPEQVCGIREQQRRRLFAFASG
jgi:hypothetical protein